MVVIGLTGGIGSGKSTFAALLAERGATVIDVDRIGREVIAPGTDGARAVIERFGTLDRSELAAKVFNDPAALSQLEAISWPLIEAEVQRLVDEAASSDAPPDIVVLDMAVLDKGLGKGLYDRIVTVEAPESTRLERLLNRGMSRGDAQARMRSQRSVESRRRIADTVIDNDGDLGALLVAVDQLLAEGEAK